MIDYDDIKSEWLPVPHNSSVEFKILKDATKVMKTSNRTGNPYPSYEFQVESGKDKFKWSTLLSQYRQMTNDAGKPTTLVGTKWKWIHVNLDGKNEYKIEYLGKEGSK